MIYFLGIQLSIYIPPIHQLPYKLLQRQQEHRLYQKYNKTQNFPM